MSKIFKLFKYGFGALDDLGMFSPTEKAIDALGQEKFVAQDLLRLDPKETSGTAGLLSKFGKPVQEEMIFTGLEDKILGLPKGEKITSQQLKDYLAENKTRVNEVIKSDKLINKQTNYEPFEFDIIEPVGQGRGRYGVGSFLADVDDDVPSALEAFAELDVDSSGANATRLGTLKNPLINKINFEDLSTQFQSEVLTPYVVQARQEGLLDPEDFAYASMGPDVENIVKFEFSPTLDADKDIVYRIQGNNTIGYEVTARKKGSDANMFVSPVKTSFNEAKLTLDGYRRKINKIDDENLKPRHESYTLPGGKNYQEIILTMPEPIDNVASIAGKFDDVIETTDNYLVVNMNAITGSPSVASFPKEMIKTLKKGEPFKLDDKNKIRYNKDTDNIEVLKKDFTMYDHTGDEKNVVVFARTKDRVDEDGRKILYVEEMQSDMSQQGRKKGLVMGQNEKKSFINKNNPIVFGDVLDSLEKLKKNTNIADLKGKKITNIDKVDRRGDGIEFKQEIFTKDLVGFENDSDLFNIRSTDGGKTFQQIPFENAHSFEDIIKKYQTKYKFNELKDNRTRKLTNQGVDKSNANLLEKDTLEDKGIVIPKTLYEDASDFVPLNLFQERILSYKKKVFKKLYGKERKKIKFGAGTPDKLAIENMNKLNNDMVKKLLTDEDYKLHIKNIKKNVIPKLLNKAEVDFGRDYITFTSLLKDYNRLGENDIIEFPVELKQGDRIYNKLSKKDFEEIFVQPAITKDNNELIQKTLEVDRRNMDEAENFDFDENSIEDVFANLRELSTNLNNAIKYDVKIRPISDLPSAPFIGSSERFTELGIKRLLKHAKDNDYDGIAFSQGKIHDKRWNQPNLTQYYDVVIPKVAKNLLKGTDAKLEYTDIWLDQDSLDEATDMIREGKRYDYFDKDVINELDQSPALIGHNDGFRGYIGDTPTIYLTDDVKEYIDSGISLYSPIIGTGIAGTVANKMIGSEEDIITEEGI